MTDMADALAEQLQAGIAEARHRAELAERAPELELKLAAHEAGVPLDHPVRPLFLTPLRRTRRPRPSSPPGIARCSTKNRPQR